MTPTELLAPVIDQPRSQELDPELADRIARHALSVWPRLDAAALNRCHGNIACIATLVERRSNLPPETIRGILASLTITEDEARTWFG